MFPISFFVLKKIVIFWYFIIRSPNATGSGSEIVTPLRLSMISKPVGISGGKFDKIFFKPLSCYDYEICFVQKCFIAMLQVKRKYVPEMCCAQYRNQWCKKLLKEEIPFNKSIILYDLSMKLSDMLSSKLKLHLWALLNEKNYEKPILIKGS